MFSHHTPGELVLPTRRKFLQQIGIPGQPTASRDMTHFGRVAKIYVDAKANEAYIADGYGNKRVAVIDADTGAIKRYWGGYGNKPDDKDPGLLATIGRNAAVARIFGISFSGYIAWVIWVFLHIYRIIGFRNRIIVMFNWAWDYIFYDNQVRLITKE